MEAILLHSRYSWYNWVSGICSFCIVVSPVALECMSAMHVGKWLSNIYPDQINSVVDSEILGWILGSSKWAQFIGLKNVLEVDLHRTQGCVPHLLRFANLFLNSWFRGWKALWKWKAWCSGPHFALGGESRVWILCLNVVCYFVLGYLSLSMEIAQRSHPLHCFSYIGCLVSQEDKLLFIYLYNTASSAHFWPFCVTAWTWALSRSIMVPWKWLTEWLTLHVSECVKEWL